MRLLQTIVLNASSPTYFLNLHDQFVLRGILDHALDVSQPGVFEWLVATLSLQGISDASAFTFMEAHGRAEWHAIEALMRGPASCLKLCSHWHFHRCEFKRSQGSCAEPAHYPDCPLPSLPLRNGNLNRMAFSLFLFIRDVCEGDLAAWMDRQLAAVPGAEASDYSERLGEALIRPLSHVFGASDKVLNLALSDLLIGAGVGRPLWQLAGQHMIAIDTLIHNLLHRTGTLRAENAEHAYGPKCYGPNGCAAIVRRLAHEIDAREFEPSFPQVFPRFVQHALWRFGAAGEVNVCNGNQIDDDHPCANVRCSFFDTCERVPLRPLKI